MLALLLGLAVAAAKDRPAPAGPPGPAELLRLEALALTYANRARAQRGLPRLVTDAVLVRTARGHAETMRDLKDLHDVAHTAPRRDRGTTARRLAAQGISECLVGENVGGLASSVPGRSWRNFVLELHAGLLASPDHRRNLLDPEFNRAGFALAAGDSPPEGPFPSARPALWITQLFVARAFDVESAGAVQHPRGLAVEIRGRRLGDSDPTVELTAPGGVCRTAPVRAEGRAFGSSFILPLGSGVWRITLRAGDGEPRNAFLADTFAPAPEAIRPDPGGE